MTNLCETLAASGRTGDGTCYSCERIVTETRGMNWYNLEFTVTPSSKQVDRSVSCDPHRRTQETGQPNSYFHLHYPPPSSRNPAPFLQQSSNFSENLRSSFIYRYLDCWNTLPVYVRQSSSLTSFKRQINLLDLRKYLK